MVPQRPGKRWSVDFISDQLANGRRFRILNIVDDCSRECAAQNVDTSISGAGLACLLEQLGCKGELPKTLVCDDSKELTSKARCFWSRSSGVKPKFLQPEKSTQNEFVEDFNGTFGDTCSNQNGFNDLDDARRQIQDWKRHFIEVRPHSSLGYLAPREYARQAA